jgi:hypothetical protein
LYALQVMYGWAMRLQWLGAYPLFLPNTTDGSWENVQLVIAVGKSGGKGRPQCRWWPGEVVLADTPPPMAEGAELIAEVPPLCPGLHLPPVTGSSPLADRSSMSAMRADQEFLMVVACWRVTATRHRQPTCLLKTTLTQPSFSKQSWQIRRQFSLEPEGGDGGSLPAVKGVAVIL